MPLIPLKPVTDYAKANKIAHGAFNVNMIAQAEAVVEAHTFLDSAAILQGAELANAFMGGRGDFQNGTLEDKSLGAKRIADAVKALSKNTHVPVVLHLDHGRDFSICKAVIDAGYTSVMIDGSSLSFEKNEELTREVVKYAHARGVSVEGELGVLAGVEDDVFSESSTYTNPMKVCEFVKNTKVDALAISYGTKHGAVKGENVKLRSEIVVASTENLRHEGLDCAIVSHGSSLVPQYIVDEINSLGGNIGKTGGVPTEELKKAISCGVSKINIDTDIRLAVTRNLRRMFEEKPEYKKELGLCKVWELLENKPDAFDPRYYLVPIMQPLVMGERIDAAWQDDFVKEIKRGVFEVVATTATTFGSIGDAGKIKVLLLDEMAEYYKKRGI